MGTFVVYIIKSALLLALLVLFFMLLMSRETFHRANRFLMLSIMALALLLPFVNVGVDTPLGNWLADVEGCFTPRKVDMGEPDDVAMDFEEIPLMPPAAKGRQGLCP